MTFLALLLFIGTVFLFVLFVLISYFYLEFYFFRGRPSLQVLGLCIFYFILTSNYILTSLAIVSFERYYYLMICSYKISLDKVFSTLVTASILPWWSFFKRNVGWIIFCFIKFLSETSVCAFLFYPSFFQPEPGFCQKSLFIQLIQWSSNG